VVSGAGAVERSVVGRMLVRLAGSLPAGSTSAVSVVSGAGAVERSVFGTMLPRVPAGSVLLVRVELSGALGKAEAVDWTTSVVGIAVDVLEGSSESPGAGLDVAPSVGEVVGVAEASTGSVVGVAVAVAVSVGEVGVVEESTELVVGLGDTVSVGAVASVWLTVGETVVSVVVGAVEVSVVGAVASVVVGAAVSVGLTVGEKVVSVVVGAVEVSATDAVASVVVAPAPVAVSRGSLTVPPFQSVAISFAIVVTHFLPLKSAQINAGRYPPDGGQIP
jgi:hypothetical protein